MTTRYKLVFLLLSVLFLASCDNIMKGYKKGKEMKNTTSDSESGISIDSLTKKGLSLNKWLLKTTDSVWVKVELSNDTLIRQQLQKEQEVWLKTELVKNIKEPMPLFFEMSQLTASEVYLNNKLLQRFGSIDKNNIQLYDPLFKPFYTTLDSTQNYVLTLKLAANHEQSLKLPLHRKLVELTLFTNEYNINSNLVSFESRSFWTVIKLGIFLILAIIHFNFYKAQPLKKSNLYFALFSLVVMLSECIWLYIKYLNHDPLLYAPLDFTFKLLSYSLANILLLFAIYKEFNIKQNWLFYILILALFSVSVSHLYNTNDFQVMIFHFMVALCFQITLIVQAIKAMDKSTPGASIFLFGILGPIVGIVIIFIIMLFYPVISNNPNALNFQAEESMFSKFGRNAGLFLFSAKDVVLAVCLSLYIALEFTQINKKLQKKIKDIDKLSKEKQAILESQKEVLEHQVTERTIELNQTINSLKTTQNQLIQKEKLASLGELTAGIAHEIQNPLNFVNNFSELSLELIEELQELKESSDQDLKEELLSDLAENQKKISHHGKRASNIVKGMLAHSRTSSGERTLTNLNELVDEYLRLSFHGMRAKDKSFNSDFKLSLDSAIPEMQIVPQDIGRVLLNIFNNAFYSVNEKAKTAGADYKPMLDVQTKLHQNHVIIDIKDNGLGISDTIKSKIFQPFFTTKPTGEGTGLGLSLSYDIISKGHNGTMEVLSQQGEYCDFKITLPIS